MAVRTGTWECATGRGGTLHLPGHYEVLGVGMSGLLMTEPSVLGRVSQALPSY